MSISLVPSVISEGKLNLVHQAVLGGLPSPDVLSDKTKPLIKDGTHRFDIYPDGAVFVQPRGALVNRAEDKMRRMAENAKNIELWGNFRAFVTAEGLVIKDDR